MFARLIRKIFKLRDDLSISFYLIDLLFRKVLRQNAGVTWAIHHTSTIRCPERMQLGIETWPGDSPNVYINAFNGIQFGDYVNVGPNVSIVSANHDLIDNSLQMPGKSIKIGKFCWLGSHVVILPEVMLGDFTIVGAGAVVTKSFEEGYCVLAGNPAKVIKRLDEDTCRKFVHSKKSNNR